MKKLISALLLSVLLLGAGFTHAMDTDGSEPITVLEIASRLCALMGAEMKADLAPDCPGAAAKAVFLGLIGADADFNAPVTRLEAFSMIVNCFSLDRADPGWERFDIYPGAEYLTPKERRVMAAALAYGFAPGSLRPFELISRAEFDAALDALIARAGSAAKSEGAAEGGTVLYGAAKLENLSFTGGLWLDCGCKEVSLKNVSADSLTIRSHRLESFEIGEDCAIGKLTLAAQSGDVEIALPGGSHIGTLVIGEGMGRVVSRAECYRGVEITGDKRELTLLAYTSSLSVSGDFAEVTIPDGVTVGVLRISGDSAKVKVEGTIGELIISGENASIEGAGKVERVSDEPHYDCALLLSIETARVLGKVSPVYAGDYTTEWAQSHDYEDYEKELWVNEKRFSSDSDYLIWVSLACQRANIFTGSQGNWTLLRSGLVGTGRPGAGTPVGVWRTTYKQEQGWITGSYMCRPVVGFLGGGYALHSRLYYPHSDELMDPSIGFPVSAGCIRMMDEDIWFIFDNVPVGSAVVVF